MVVRKEKNESYSAHSNEIRGHVGNDVSIAEAPIVEFFHYSDRKRDEYRGNERRLEVYPKGFIEDKERNENQRKAYDTMRRVVPWMPFAFGQKEQNVFINELRRFLYHFLALPAFCF